MSQTPERCPDLGMSYDRLLRHHDTGMGPREAQRPSPGKSTLTARLAARRIDRKADDATARDDNGVAAGADTAVSNAASSTGAPLPDVVRERFEASVGADLSGVRVHTGDASADAAHAVGARAYTIGNDIHFAAGEYQPMDPFGLHLLAHEVAHTVQQSGGAPHRQNKLEVSTPGDAAEIEADRAADAMVAGAAATITGVGTALHRDAIATPEGDNKSSPNQVGEQDRAAVIKVLNKWQKQSNRYLSSVAHYLSRNWTIFLGGATSAPSLGWGKEAYHSVINAGVTFGVSKAAAPVAALIGGIGGPPGALIGFAFGKLTDAVVSHFVEKLAGKLATNDEQVAAATKAVADKAVEKLDLFDSEREAATAIVDSAHDEVTKLVFETNTQEGLARIHDWCVAETAKVATLFPNSDALAKRMLRDWAMENALDGKHVAAGVNLDQWKKALGVDHLQGNREIFAHQCRRHWGVDMHLDGGDAFVSSMVAANEPTQQYVFSRARDPKAFATRFLTKLTTEQFAYLHSGGGFSLVCEVSTLIMPDGAQIVDRWSYQLSLDKTDFPDEPGKKAPSRVALEVFGPFRQLPLVSF
jgi:hypothetical protein